MSEKFAKNLEAKKMYRNGVKYAITISPSPEKQYFGHSAKARYAVFHVGIVKALHENLAQYAKWELYPEVGKKNYFLHVHGYIIFKDAVGAMLAGLPNIKNTKFMVGRQKHDYMIDIDTITNEEDWEKYIHKDEELMKPFVESIKGRTYGITSDEVYLFDQQTGYKIK